MTNEEMTEMRTKMVAVSDSLNEMLSKLDNKLDDLPEDIETVSGDNRGKFVCRNDGHLFFHARRGEAKLRLHIHPDGHYNIQTTEQIGTGKVAFKGSIA